MSGKKQITQIEIGKLSFDVYADPVKGMKGDWLTPPTYDTLEGIEIRYKGVDVIELLYYFGVTDEDIINKLNLL